VTARAPLRRLALTAHVVASVGWLGALTAFLVLAIVGLTSRDPDLVRGVYLASEPLARYAIVPLAIAALATGVIESLITSWGLIRHYWVVVKLVITVVATLVLLVYLRTVDHVAGVAASGADLDAMRSPSFVLHAAAAIVLLLAATALAIHKPAGLTRHGWRRQRALRARGAA